MLIPICFLSYFIKTFEIERITLCLVLSAYKQFLIDRKKHILVGWGTG